MVSHTDFLLHRKKTIESFQTARSDISSLIANVDNIKNTLSSFESRISKLETNAITQENLNMKVELKNQSMDKDIEELLTQSDSFNRKISKNQKSVEKYRKEIKKFKRVMEKKLKKIESRITKIKKKTKKPASPKKKKILVEAKKRSIPKSRNLVTANRVVIIPANETTVSTKEIKTQIKREEIKKIK